MLTTATPFPQVGSFALLDHDGRRHLVRIQGLKGEGAFVSFPLVRDIASGNRRVPLADLIDGTPLSAEERAEMERLREELDGMTRPGTARQARWSALRQRDINAGTLAVLMASVPNPALRGSQRAAA